MMMGFCKNISVLTKTFHHRFLKNCFKNTAGLDLVIRFTFNSFYDVGLYHIETSPLKWTGFNIMAASVMKELNSILEYVSLLSLWTYTEKRKK